MKKIFIFTICLLITILFMNKIKAFTVSTNLINPDNYSWNSQLETGTGKARIKITGTDYIAVNSATEYFLLPTYMNKRVVTDYNWKALPYFEETLPNIISLFNGTGELIETLTPAKKLYAEGIHVGYALKFENAVKKIKIQELNLTSNAMLPHELSSFFDEFVTTLDSSLIMFDVADFSHLPYPCSFEYNYNEGSYDVGNLKFGDDLNIYKYGIKYGDIVSPIIEVENYTFTTSVDNPITIENLIKQISLIAYDEIDGDLTSSISYLAEEYYDLVINKLLAKDRTVGEYNIKFMVSDSSANYSECIIKINVVDLQSPVIDYGASIIEYIKEVDDTPVTIETIISNILVTDNYSGVTLNIYENSYSGNEKVLGSYKVKLRYFDEASNYTDVSVTIKVIDTICPVINIDETFFDISYQDLLSIEAILNILNITVIDNYDINLSYEVITNEYLGKENIVGNYQVIVRAIDLSGNVTDKELLINVIDDVSPIFYLDKTKVIIDSNDLIDAAYIKGIIASKYNLSLDSFDIEIIQDGYNDNIMINDVYQIGVKVIRENELPTYELLELEVRNTDKPNWFIRAIKAIKKIFQFIWNIIKWPFVKLFNLIL